MGASAGLQLAPGQPPASGAVITPRWGPPPPQREADGSPRPGRAGGRRVLPGLAVYLQGAPRRMASAGNGNPDSWQNQPDFHKERTRAGLHLAPVSPYCFPPTAGCRPAQGAEPRTGCSSASPLFLEALPPHPTRGSSLFVCPLSLQPSSGFFLFKSYLFYIKSYTHLYKKASKTRVQKGRASPLLGSVCVPETLYIYIFFFK